MSISITDLGLTKEQLTELVVSRLVDEAVAGHDEERLFARVQDSVRKHFNDAVTRVADEHFSKGIEEFLRGLILQPTNQWGEAKGKPTTVTEYIEHRAEAYMTERVNYDGKAEGNNYAWKGTQTRLVHLVHQHLHYSIEKGVKNALSGINESLAEGLAKTVKIKASEALAGLETTVSIK